MIWVLCALVGFTLALGYWQLRRRGVHRWGVPYILQTARRRHPEPGQPVHVLLCIADHYEPRVGQPSNRLANARVERWLHNYPRLCARFRDSDGRPPRHTFFFPPEEYEAGWLDMLAELCRQGLGEVEIHLHHDNDNPENLRRTLLDYKHLLAERHGLLSCRPNTGEVSYGFIHGNWALCNSRPDGRWCGVDNELDILRETGCYADFTLPSAPSPTQTSTINSIYYSRNRPGCRRSHDWGVAAGKGPPPDHSLMLIQGPLLLDWNRRKWGLVPRLENACLQHNQPPTVERLQLWMKARVQIPSRPEWVFVKLHTHGAPEWNADMLLGEPMIRLHDALARQASEDVNFHYHYLTAREMYNLVRSAEAGTELSIAEARNWELQPIHAPQVNLGTDRVG